MDMVLLVFTALATAFAAWSAWEAHTAVKITQQTAEAALIASFLDQYSEPEMAQSLRTIRLWRERHGDDFATTWIAELRGNVRSSEPDAQQVDDARRRVSSYFQKAYALASTITENALRAIAYQTSINLYIDVVDPLELALNPKRADDVLKLLRDRIGRCKEDAIHAVPPK